MRQGIKGKYQEGEGEGGYYCDKRETSVYPEGRSVEGNMRRMDGWMDVGSHFECKGNGRLREWLRDRHFI